LDLIPIGFGLEVYQGFTVVNFWVGLVGEEVVVGDIGITLPDFLDGQEPSIFILSQDQWDIIYQEVIIID